MPMSRIEYLLAFLKDSPEDPFVHYALAMEHLKLQDRAQAAAYFEHLVQHHPGYVGTYYHYAKLKLDMGDAEAARALYRTGIATAQAAKDAHSARELQAALAELELMLD